MQFGKQHCFVAAGLALSLCTQAAAQLPPPPPPPATLWSFLGIPQGYRYIRDNGFNRNGNNPNAERKPPLKAIADPKNLKSDDPAIKKAAEIKQAEDLKKQKIKAVKYLASIGCGCYNRDGSITDALLKSMDDCTEEVRLATVQSISVAAAGEMCANCKMKSCCSEELSNKLYEMAYERDETGCFLEPSERVRLAAAEALRVCCPGGGDDIIFEAAPAPVIPPSGGEQPSVLPESGGERPALPPVPAIPGPTPAIPPAPAGPITPIPAGPVPPAAPVRPAPSIPPGALPTDPLPPAPAAGPVSLPRSSRRTAMLHPEVKQTVATRLPAREFAEIGSPAATPHWAAATQEQSVFFRSPASEPQPLEGFPYSNLANAQTADSEVPAIGSGPAPGENFAPIVTRLPPVDEAAQQPAGAPAIAPPPLPGQGVSALPVSVRRIPRRSEEATPPPPAGQKKTSRAGAPRKLPGQEFGVGTVTSVRFKEGLAILEFENAAALPPGSVIRAYHEFALTGKSPVCDLEVVDTADGRTVAVARAGSELTALNVGDRAIVLR